MQAHVVDKLVTTHAVDKLVQAHAVDKLATTSQWQSARVFVINTQWSYSSFESRDSQLNEYNHPNNAPAFKTYSIWHPTYMHHVTCKAYKYWHLTLWRWASRHGAQDASTIVIQGTEYTSRLELFAISLSPNLIEIVCNIVSVMTGCVRWPRCACCPSAQHLLDLSQWHLTSKWPSQLPAWPASLITVSRNSSSPPPFHSNSFNVGQQSNREEWNSWVTNTWDKLYLTSVRLMQHTKLGAFKKKICRTEKKLENSQFFFLFF